MHIGHAQRINFGRSHPKFPAQNFPPKILNEGPQKRQLLSRKFMVKENSRLFVHIPLLITGILLIYYYVLSFHYRKRCTVFKLHDLLA